ncbi:hypothetical protein IW261DRAFT_1490112 [Armillaria novae-zelandiae]|uniref:MYND-type domain-containing protein n=1 Tax=Armillaria novae-zelandiae TaxID=153914 RepID=A0AA39P3U6_9AGAR|nr:hypothetical protein IW261DRAFT_1490112 [Armillaria novae-zelandiae]
MQNTCLVCDIPTSTRCAKCSSVYYCSKAHIAQDWRVHKAYCKRVRAATDTFDAILFGVNEVKPRVIKLPWSYGPVDEDEPGGWQMLEREPWLGGKSRCPRFFWVGRFGMNGPPLGRLLALWYDENFLMNGSPINRCIQNVTKGRAPHPWAGNVLALRSRGLHSLDYYDDTIIEEDLAPLVRFFEDYGKEDLAVPVDNAAGSKERENTQVTVDIDTASASVTVEPSTSDRRPLAFVVFVFLFFLCAVFV